jgi:hypothetical protein
LTILPDQAIEIVAIEKKVMVGRVTSSAYCLNHDPSGRSGDQVLRGGSYVICKVQNNKSPPKSVVPGRGLKIVHELVKTLDGSLKHKFGSHGSISLLAFPYSDGAQ